MLPARKTSPEMPAPSRRPSVVARRQGTPQAVPPWWTLQNLNRLLAMGVPLLAPYPENFSKPKAVERWTFNLRGQPVQRVIIYLRSDVGCEFGVRTGGCAGCRHWRLGTAGQRVALPNMYLLQYRAAIASCGYPPVVCIYNEGNMLNDWELPQRQLLTMVRDLAEHGVRRLILEARPEYITDHALANIKQAAATMEVEIGIGLESSHDFIRNHLLLKRITLPSYQRAVRCLRRHGLRSLAYVVLKPAFLNEAQAVADAIRTIRYAFGVGTDAASVEPIGVEPYTVTSLMQQAGHFRPAWLWSLVRVAQATVALGEVRLGGFQFQPPPQTLPRNCNACTARAIEAINRYNATYDIAILAALRCEGCYTRYRHELRGAASHIDQQELAEKLRLFLLDSLRYDAHLVDDQPAEYRQAKPAA